MQRYEDILEQINEALRPYAGEEKDLNENTELVADLGLDSVQVMQLLLEIEDRLDVSIPLNILPDVRTVKDLALQLQKLTNQ